MSTAILRNLASGATAILSRTAGPAPAPAGAPAAAGDPGRAASLEYESLGASTSSSFQPFTAGAMGHFPYYWQNPTNLRFNTKTYRWISSSLKAGTPQLELGGPFTNLYIQALAKVTFNTSSEDEQEVTKAAQTTQNRQGRLLEAWKSAGYSLTGNQPINGVINTIATTWASPATNLKAMRNAPVLSELLNMTPPAGQAVLPVLSLYLQALDAQVTLVNAATMSSGYVQRALAAVQRPSEANGGLVTDDGLVQPAYQVATPVAKIIAGLAAKDRAHQLKMTVTRVGDDHYRVTPDGDNPFTVSIANFLTVTPEGHSTDALQIATGSSSSQVELTFTGVTTVYFGPMPFVKSSGEYWYWKNPIADAVANGQSDVTGFKFQPRPQIDFSRQGSFGFLTGVAISNHPVITITASGSDASKVANYFKSLAADRWGVGFLGTTVAQPGSQTGYSKKIDTAGPATVTFSPPATKADLDVTELTAHVLGAQAVYPAA